MLESRVVYPQAVNALSVRYDGRCRERSEPRKGVISVVRFRNLLDGDVVVDDQVRGKVVFENAELDDLIIARPDGSSTCNFSVIIDDFDMIISHVIRGDDHLNNMPRQMNMLHAPGAAGGCSDRRTTRSAFQDNPVKSSASATCDSSVSGASASCV